MKVLLWLDNLTHSRHYAQTANLPSETHQVACHHSSWSKPQQWPCTRILRSASMVCCPHTGIHYPGDGSSTPQLRIGLLLCFSGSLRGGVPRFQLHFLDSKGFQPLTVLPPGLVDTAKDFLAWLEPSHPRVSRLPLEGSRAGVFPSKAPSQSLVTSSHWPANLASSKESSTISTPKKIRHAAKLAVPLDPHLWVTLHSERKKIILLATLPVI